MGIVKGPTGNLESFGIRRPVRKVPGLGDGIAVIPEVADVQGVPRAETMVHAPQKLIAVAWHRT